MPAETLTIIDNRTGKKYEVPIIDETIKGMQEVAEAIGLKGNPA